MVERFPDPRTAQAGRQVDLTKRVRDLERSVSSPGVVPIGARLFHYGTIPAGWLALDGATVTVAEWQKLAAAVPQWVVGDLIQLPAVAASAGAVAIVRAR